MDTLDKNLKSTILQNLDDKTLFSAMLTNKNLLKSVDENFWMNRLIRYYPQTLNYKRKGETWKQYYLNVSRNINLMKKEGFNYTKGDTRIILETEFFPNRVLELFVKNNEYEDLLFFVINELRQEYHLPKFIYGRPEWETYKKKKMLKA